MMIYNKLSIRGDMMIYDELLYIINKWKPLHIRRHKLKIFNVFLFIFSRYNLKEIKND